jgi:hypothetical protein
MYTPDRWMLVRIQKDDGKHIYKILGSWYGGYLHGDSWRLNSGITKIEEDKNVYRFYGSSGSVYECHKDSYGASMYAYGEIRFLADKYPNTITIYTNEPNMKKIKEEVNANI